MRRKLALVAPFLLLPLLVAAQTSTGTNGFTQILCGLVNAIVNPLLELIAAVAFAYFLWGGAKFIIDTAQGESGEDGRRGMLWGIIGLAVIFGAFGIVNFAISGANSIFGSNVGGIAPGSCASIGGGGIPNGYTGQ